LRIIKIKIMNNYWKDGHYKELEKVKTFKEMLKIAFDILENMPKPITQVCGPISTGGKGSIEENLKMFPKAAEWLSRKGYNVFSQAPFESPIERVKCNYSGYPYALLDEFYLPVFKSKLINIFAFLPGWQSSTGAKWEHEQAEKLGIEILYLPEDWENQ